MAWLVDARATLRVHDDGDATVARVAKELDAERVLVVERAVDAERPLSAVLEALAVARQKSETDIRRSSIILIKGALR
ncbi:MAG: hypothetical protein Q8R60_06750 [Mycobacteriales bacterium]|nr:hypothetical protein [Mycobacteriales bacterium]